MAATTATATTTTAPAKLPTVAEILASEDYLSDDDASIAIVRVGNYVVKYWANAAAQAHEASALKWVAANTTVRVPKLVATLKDKKTGFVFNILEHIPGTNLSDEFDSLSKPERAHISAQLASALASLRAPASPGYIGGLNRAPCRDYLLWSPAADPRRSGPFDNQAQLIDGLAAHIADNHTEPYVAHVRDLLAPVLTDHRIVFTHGDLHMKNIMLVPAGSLPDSGGRKFDIAIIDWQAAGWYPEYWEYTNALVRCRGGRDTDWLVFARGFFEGHDYAKEFLAMNLVQDLLIY